MLVWKIFVTFLTGQELSLAKNICLEEIAHWLKMFV